MVDSHLQPFHTHLHHCFVDLTSCLGMSYLLRTPSPTSCQKSTSFDDSSSEERLPGQQNPPPETTDQHAYIVNQDQAYPDPGISVVELQHHFLQGLRHTYYPSNFEPHRPGVPLRRCRINMEVTADLEGLLPDGARDPTTGQQVVNLDSISIFTFTTPFQLQDMNVDYIKQAIQDLCWDGFRIPIRKRDFKLWLQVVPPSLQYPYGKFEPLDFDTLWIEVLNVHQIPFGSARLHLRAHHPESIFD